MKEKQLKNFKILEVLQKGETRYILTIGRYSNREEAKQAALEIESQLNITPWARTFESINYQKIMPNPI